MNIDNLMHSLEARHPGEHEYLQAVKEGGLGVISAAQPGYLEHDFKSNTIEANIRALTKEIVKAREISGGNGLLGINLMVAAEHYDVYAKAISEMYIDVIISSAGLPLELPSLLS